MRMLRALGGWIEAGRAAIETTPWILVVGRVDTSPKRQRGIPRWRFGLVSDQPTASVKARGVSGRSTRTGAGGTRSASSLFPHPTLAAVPGGWHSSLRPFDPGEKDTAKGSPVSQAYVMGRAGANG